MLKAMHAVCETHCKNKICLAWLACSTRHGNTTYRLHWIEVAVMSGRERVCVHSHGARVYVPSEGVKAEVASVSRYGNWCAWGCSGGWAMVMHSTPNLTCLAVRKHRCTRVLERQTRGHRSVYCVVRFVALSHLRLWRVCGRLAGSHGRALACAAEWGGVGKVVGIDFQKQCFCRPWMIGNGGSSVQRHQPHLCDVQFVVPFWIR